MILNDWNIVYADRWAGTSAKSAEEAEAIRQRLGGEGVVMTADELRTTSLYAQKDLESAKSRKRSEVVRTLVDVLIDLDPQAVKPQARGQFQQKQSKLEAIEAATTIEELEAL